MVFLEAAAVDLSVVFHSNDEKALIFFWSLDFVDPPYACVTPPSGYIFNISFLGHDTTCAFATIKRALR